MPADIEVLAVAHRRYGELKVFVQSFLNQTAENWRLSVYHDGPDDRIAAVMQPFLEQAQERVALTVTERRYDDFGHSLREIGLRSVACQYVLITNGDNYYVPRFVEIVTRAIEQTDADVVLYDMIHSHARPGGRPLPPYSLFETSYSRRNIDVGSAVVRAELAKAAGFRDKSHDGDATYFEDVARIKGAPLRICKVPQVLFVHN
jgi:Glycosyl transferase family 2